MKYALLFVCLIVCAFPCAAQQSNDKEAKKRAKEAEKRERAEYYARISTPPVEVLPLSVNQAGELLLAVLPKYEFSFAGYHPGADVFGTETPRLALFTCPLDTGGMLRYGSNAAWFMAFAIAAQDGQAKVIATTGIARRTLYGLAYTSMLPDLEFRSQLNAVLMGLREAAQEMRALSDRTKADTEDAYRSLTIGQSLAEVEKVLGKGKLIEETETKELHAAEYEWKSSTVRIVLRFENGKLSRKSQVELP